MPHYNLRILTDITKCCSLYYKCVGWIYDKMLHPLLHNAHIITKSRNRHYKMRNVLQNASLLQNAAEHRDLCGVRWRSNTEKKGL